MMEATITPANNRWFGPNYIDAGWAPAPRYLLRRSRILRHLAKAKPGRLIEVGSASGALLSELSSKGFECTGLETSEQALMIARQLHDDNDIKFQNTAEASWVGKFEYCLSFEVLEHIERDSDALKQWVSWLKPGGKMLLSVPAHPRLWNARDIWAGHFRRYRRDELEHLFENAGLNIEKIECYGFPLANILEKIIERSYREYLNRDSGENRVSKAEQTAISGIERSTHIKAFNYYAYFPGSWVMRSMITIQRLFLKSNFGNGFLVVATKS